METTEENEGERTRAQVVKWNESARGGHKCSK